jgi:hypothetical protein
MILPNAKSESPFQGDPIPIFDLDSSGKFHSKASLKGPIGLAIDKALKIIGVEAHHILFG